MHSMTEYPCEDTDAQTPFCPNYALIGIDCIWCIFWYTKWMNIPSSSFIIAPVQYASVSRELDIHIKSWIFIEGFDKHWDPAGSDTPPSTSHPPLKSICHRSFWISCDDGLVYYFGFRLGNLITGLTLQKQSNFFCSNSFYIFICHLIVKRFKPSANITPLSQPIL